MRLKSINNNFNEKKELEDFSNWILAIGHGSGQEEESETWVHIPSDMLITPSDNPLEDITKAVYSELINNYMIDHYFQERAILAVTNEIVDSVNDFVAGTLHQPEIVYRSSDSIQGPTEDDSLYPIEFLNDLKFTGVPNHALKLKVGMPIMLLRNLDQAAGLCNGTRLIVTRLGQWSVEGRIMTGNNKGQTTIIPRIVFLTTDKNIPFTLRRKQFPISVCFAMTVNKSQGQTLKNIGLLLTKEVFTHGQLYVAVSRITSRDGLKILLPKNQLSNIGKARNIVFTEVL